MILLWLAKHLANNLQNLGTVFKRIQEAGLKLKTKCTFFQERVQYLAHVISREGVSPDNEKIKKVASWQVPASTQEVQQFLGFANYYRRFIWDFLAIDKPLHHYTDQGVIFKWNDTCQLAFDKLWNCLSTPPVLAFLTFHENIYILDTDASDCGIGGVLSQIDDNGLEWVIAYGSHVLSKPERQCCVTRRELLAVVVFTDRFQPYLTGRPFVLRRDHGCFTWLANFKEPTGQLARWLEKPSIFE